MKRAYLQVAHCGHTSLCNVHWLDRISSRRALRRPIMTAPFDVSVRSCVAEREDIVLLLFHMEIQEVEDGYV